MVYVVSARKWRPQTFDEIVGQPNIVTTLKNSIKNNRIANSYLFSGTRGVGKTTTARILSKALNCINGPTDNPCGRCKFCNEIRDGSSLDVIEIDGASNRGIDDIRDIKENVQYAPSAGKHKIYIIDEVHMLTKEAFNALLKTLEEPPGKVVFIFATTEINKVPDTILSRCQWFEFKSLKTEDIVSQLEFISKKDNISVSREILHMISVNAGGSMRDAEMLFDQIISFCGDKVEEDDVRKVIGLADKKAVEDIVDGIIKKDIKSIISIIGSVRQKGCNIDIFYRELVAYFRNIMVVKALPKQADNIINKSPGEISNIRRLGKNFSKDQIHQIFTILLKLEKDLKTTSFPEVVLEMALIKISELEPLLPIAHVLENIEDIKNMLGRGNYIPEPNDCAYAEIPTIKAPVDTSKVKKPPLKKAENAFKLKGEDSTLSTLQENNLEPSNSRLQNKWQQLKEEIGKRRPLLLSVLERGTIADIDNKITLRFKEKESLYIDVILKPENSDIISCVTEKILGKRLNVNIETVGPNKDDPCNRDSKGLKQGEQLLSNRIIDEAIEIFKGSIV